MDSECLPYVIPLGSQKPKHLTLVPSEPDSRYKCRQLQVQVVGKSKMIRTHLVNVLDVSKDMLVPPQYIGTFMAYFCGAQHKFDPKKPEREQSFISGEHDTKDLSKIMSQFISEVLSCPVCNLPEINIYIEKKKVMATCRSCGSTSELNFSNEKFKRYIINHPPNQTKGGEFNGNKQTKKKESRKKSSKHNHGSEEDTEPTEKGKPKKEKKSPKSSTEGSNKEVVWYSDTSEAAAQKRLEEMVPESFVKKNKEEDIQEAKAMAKKGKSVDALKAFQTEKGLTDQEFVRAIFFGLFEKDLQKEVEKCAGTLLPFVQSYDAQSCLMECIADFCDSNGSSEKMPYVFKAFYDADLLEEENICRWHSVESTNEVYSKTRNIIKPFVEWLQSAEEESEEEEEEED